MQFHLEKFRAKICNFSKIGDQIENNSFRKGKIQGEIDKKLQEGQVIWPNVFQTIGDQVYSKKGWLIFRKEGTKAFLKGWLYVLICPTPKIRQRRSEFLPWVKSYVEWESEKGKEVNSRTNKKANDEWHTCTLVPRLHGTTGLNKGFEKAGLKWIKSMGDPCKARVSQLVYLYI